MGMFNKLKNKLEETKAELGLSSRPTPSHTQHPPPQQGQQYPGHPGQPGQPGQSGYQYQQQQPGFPPQGGRPYYGPPPGQYQPQYPPPGPGQAVQNQNWGQPQPQQYPPVPTSSRPDLGPPPPIPVRPAGFEASSQPPGASEDEATPPGSPHPDLDNCRPVSPFPEHTPEDNGDADGNDHEPELTEDEVWDGIPSDQVVLRPDGRRDALGGQVTGHERHLHRDPIGGHNAPTKVLGLYYPEWRVYADRPPSKMREDLATHMYYAFAAPQSNGYLGYMDYYSATQKGCDNTSGCLNAMRRLRWKYPNLKLMLSCGGEVGSKNFKDIAAKPWKRVRFAKSVRYWLRKYELNGVDVDWEFPDSPENGANYIQLLRTLREYLPRPYYQITTALPAGEWVLKNIDLRTASYYLDYLNLMCYDMAGPWSPKSGHQAPLYAPNSDPSALSCDKAVNYLVAQGFPRWKIVLGMPNYAQYFPNATKPDEDFDKSKAGQIEYRDMDRQWRRNARVDRTIAAAWHVDAEKGFMSFDTPETVRIKGEYVKGQGLAGMFFWHGVGDVWGGGLSLINASHQALNS